MKVITPEIAWHEREPVYSVDFQTNSGDKKEICRLASGGVDKIVRIWQFSKDNEGKGCVEFLANLRRHTAAVNVVRFSKNGELLASAGDDTAIILWKLSDVPQPSSSIFTEDDAEEDRETWVCHKTLRGHLGDVADLSWSRDNRYLVSGSVDNTAILWDVKKAVKLWMFTEHKSYVQGVTYDPLGDLVATMCADRSLRIYNVNQRNCLHNVSKMGPLPSANQSSPAAKTDTATESKSETTDGKPKTFRIFHDDSLRSFFRRLDFSSDGQLLITSAGCVETAEGKGANGSFIFSRGSFAKPAMFLPSGDKATTAVRINPQLFQLRPSQDGTKSTESEENAKEWEKNKSLFCLPYRIVFAVASKDSVLLYDSQQTLPIALLRNIHYQEISDLSWSSDGSVLVISSTDGFCTIATFEPGELGEVYTEAKRVSARQAERKEKEQEEETSQGKEKEDNVEMKEESPQFTPEKSSNTSLIDDKRSAEKSNKKSPNISQGGNSANTSPVVKKDSERSKVNSDSDTKKSEVSTKVESLCIKDKEGSVKKKRIQFTTLSLK